MAKNASIAINKVIIEIQNLWDKNNDTDTNTTNDVQVKITELETTVTKLFNSLDSINTKITISKKKQQTTVINLVTSMLAKAITTKCHMYRGKQNEHKTSIVDIANITRLETDNIIKKNIENKRTNNQVPKD